MDKTGTIIIFNSLIWGNQFKNRVMENVRQGGFGLLERTLLEFDQKGNSSIEDIKQYLYEKYKVTVSHSVLRKRIESAGV
mgnify:CR=1 FL=1